MVFFLVLVPLDPYKKICIVGNSFFGAVKLDPHIGFLGFVLVIGGASFFWTAYDIDWGIQEEIKRMQAKPIIPNITKLLEERVKLQYVLAISVLVMLAGAYFLYQVLHYHSTH